MTTDFTFTVYGLEFCRLLAATALFQDDPKKNPPYAAVRSVVRSDGLTMIGLSPRSAAIGTISTADQDGAGFFSIPAAQVRVVLAMFKKALPKDVGEDEYVLSVRVTDSEIRIREESGLFDHDELRIAVMPPGDLEPSEKSDSESVMQTAAVVHRLLQPGKSHELNGGIHVSADQLTRLGRATKILDDVLRLRTNGHHILGVIGDQLIVLIPLGLDDQRPAPDDTSLTQYRDSLDELVDQAVL